MTDEQQLADAFSQMHNAVVFINEILTRNPALAENVPTKMPNGIRCRRDRGRMPSLGRILREASKEYCELAAAAFGAIIGVGRVVHLIC
jgi:hypothetical protein